MQRCPGPHRLLRVLLLLCSGLTALTPVCADPHRTNQATPFVPPVLGAPNQTLYVNNLNEKVKDKELKAGLKALFSQYGKVLDIVAMKSFARRGQAFIVFENVQTATIALQKLQGSPFEDKPMRINYARSKSDIVAKADGTYTQRAKRPLPPRHTPQGSEGGAPPKRAAVDAETGAGEAEPPSSRPQNGLPGELGQNQGYGAPGQFAPPPVAPAADAEAPPNKILFLTDLPEESNEMMLAMLFNQFPGFKEVRLVPTRPDIAFVEYETDMQAAEARKTLQGFNIKPTHPLKIDFAKK